MTKDVLVFGEIRGGELKKVTKELIGAGRLIAGSEGAVDAVLVGKGAGDAAGMIANMGLRKITVLSNAKNANNAKKQSTHGAAVATAVATARDLVNTPPSHLFPAEFARRAKVLGEAAGLEVEILDDKALKRAGYGGVIGVGQGSSRPPRLVRLIHRGSQLAKPKQGKQAKNQALTAGAQWAIDGITNALDRLSRPSPPRQQTVALAEPEQ